MGVEILDNGTRVLTAPGATFGTDALLLARFAQPRRNERALDLCSGCGIVSLVWHDAGHRGPCTALEIDPAASALCAAALAENTDAAHIAPVCGDLRQFCTAGPEQGQYDFAACNPPRALSRSVWLLSRTAPTPRPGFSSSKPRRAAKPACASSRTF